MVPACSVPVSIMIWMNIVTWIWESSNGNSRWCIIKKLFKKEWVKGIFRLEKNSTTTPRIQCLSLGSFLLLKAERSPLAIATLWCSFFNYFVLFHCCFWKYFMSAICSFLSRVCLHCSSLHNSNLTK